MDKISKGSKVVIGALVVIVIILLVFLYGGRNQTPAQAPSNSAVSPGNATASTTAAAGGVPSGSGSQPTGSGSKTPRPSVPTPPPPIIIRLITPVTNDQWKIGVTNPISWDNAANFTGEIDLLDAQGNFVGVILSETGTNQTSYGWDTREYSLARYNPLKKEVVPGTYKIQLKFDGNNLPPITSPVITITN